MTKKRNLPIGIQTFEELISRNCVYIDKTQFIQNLISVGKPYFLSRPRRFGKSLFLSTLKSYFEGRKDLFEGLAISKSEKEWKKYPVFYFDFNGQNFDSALALYISLDNKISEYEKIYGKKDYLLELEAAENANKEELWKNQISIRFKNLIKSAYEKTGEQVVVLVDEYDKPLLQNVKNEQIENQIRNILKGNLVPLYAGYDGITDNIEVLTFLKEIRYGKVEDFMKRINNIFASAPKKTNQKMYELDCQAFVWLIFKLMGEFIICEVQNGEGRSDAVLWEKEIIYIFEFKMDATAQEAIDHINSQDYPIAYKNDGRKIIKVGVNYSSEKKQLTDWIIQEE